jgi:hypothetical protein
MAQTPLCTSYGLHALKVDVEVLGESVIGRFHQDADAVKFFVEITGTDTGWRDVNKQFFGNLMNILCFLAITENVFQIPV